MEDIRLGAYRNRAATLSRVFDRTAAAIREEQSLDLRRRAERDLARLQEKFENLLFKCSQRASQSADGFNYIGDVFTDLEDQLQAFREDYFLESARRRNMIRERIKYQDRSIIPLQLKTWGEKGGKEPKSLRKSPKSHGSHSRSSSHQPGNSTLGQSSSWDSSIQRGGGSESYGGSGPAPMQYPPTVHPPRRLHGQRTPLFDHSHNASHTPSLDQHQFPASVHEHPSFHSQFGPSTHPIFQHLSQPGYPPTGFPQVSSSDVTAYPPAMNVHAQRSGFGAYGSHSSYAPQGYSFPPQGQMGPSQYPGPQGHGSHTRNSSSTLDDLYDTYGDPQ